MYINIICNAGAVVEEGATATATAAESDCNQSLIILRKQILITV